MIVYYISSHGFGHTVRACEVIRQLPKRIPLLVRTAAPEWFLKRELAGREFELRPALFDCGTLGPDSTSIDLGRTLERMEELQNQNDRRLEEEADCLRSCGARLVVADIVPFALRAAQEARVPSILVANFTWPAIYQHLVDYYCEDALVAARGRALIARIHADDRAGDLLLAPGLDVPMQACRRRRNVPIIARRGKSRREELCKALGLDASRPIYLVYLGVEGMRGMDWTRGEALRGLQLVSFNPPGGAGDLIRNLPEDLIDHADAASSVDAVVAKLGYSIVAECLAAGTPLLYPPRPEFIEVVAIEAALAKWGGGIKLEEEEFRTLKWREPLERMALLKGKLQAPDCSGGEVCAEIIEGAWNEGEVM